MSGIDSQSKAIVELTASWRSEHASHTERYLAREVNLWRDIFPPGLREGLMGLDVDQSVKLAYLPGEALDPPSSHLIKTVPRACFTPPAVLGQKPVPRLGRFYPRGVMHQGCGCFPQDMRPARVISRHGDALTVDCNPAMSGKPFSLTATVLEYALKTGDTGGQLSHLMEEALQNGPGMQAPLPDVPTDFGSEPYARADESDDGCFYAAPRLTSHVDAQASAFLRQEYLARLEPGMRVLDLMSGLDSHLPRKHGLSVVGLGLNQQEMEANPALDEHRVHDLNTDPTLPFADGEFDALLASLSVEYLTRPRAVMAGAVRVLRPGGRIILSVSNRWFPGKVINLWLELHEFERLGFMLDLLTGTGRFTDLETLSIRNWWRPEDDPHFQETWTSDPVYLVSGVRL